VEPAPRSTTDPPPLLTATGICKRFGSVEALAGVDLDLRAGEIHAVLGENGAGKSTLMHVLSGVVRPDTGVICVDGIAVAFDSPRAAQRVGIGMVHQHFTLVDALTVAENLALSLSPDAAWRFQPARVAADAAALAARIGLRLAAPDTAVAELPVGARQRLEILKALASASRVTILDEPTAVLTPQEVGQLFAMLRQLRAQGRAVIFITHKLREVKELADRVTIMRRGRVVATLATATVSERALAEQMVGEAIPTLARATGKAKGTVVLEVSDLHVRNQRGLRSLEGVSLRVCAGEVLGVAGVDGNGQRELFEVLVGMRAPDLGRVRIAGTTLTTFTPRAALAAGVGHIPPDRRHEGLVLPMSVAENLILHRTLLSRFSRRGILRRAAAREFAAALIRRYAIRCPGLDAPVSLLSGGNQQRVVVARQLAQQPAVLVTVNPTRGLDVAAASGVARALIEARDRGCALLLISTDLDEVLDLSDRVCVLARGRLSEPLEPPIDTERLGLLMAGAEP
jgi:ABC-type uncharacterized transport system ATPase subunit